MAEEDVENIKPRKRKVKSMKGKEETGLTAEMSSSSAKLKLDQLLQQVVAQSTKDATDAKKKKKKKPKSQEDEDMLESLRKAEGIEGLHKDKDTAVLANMYEPDDNSKSEKGNKQRQRRSDKNKNANLEEGKQNVDVIEPAVVAEKKKKKAKKKKEGPANLEEVEQEVSVIRDQPTINTPRPPPRKMKSPNSDTDNNLESKIEDASPYATPRKKKINKPKDEQNDQTQQKPTDITNNEHSVIKPKEKKKKVVKPEAPETEEQIVMEKEQETDISAIVKTKKKKVPTNEEDIFKDEKVLDKEEHRATPIKTKTKKIKKSQPEKEEIEISDNEDHRATPIKTKTKKIKKSQPEKEETEISDNEDEQVETEPVKSKHRKKKKAVIEGDGEGQEEEKPVEEDTHPETEKVKTPKRKQRKNLKTADEETIDAPVAPVPEETPREIEDMGEVMALMVHRTDKLKNDFHILHPLVRVHVVNEETGVYIEKQHMDRAVTSYFETSNEAVKTILPMMTQPFDFKERKSTIPVWEDLLVFNENFNYFIQPDPKVILLFELLDFVSMNAANNQFNSQKEEGGWHRIAWAFLKVLGKNGKVNIGTKLRLQLFVPPTKIQPQVPGQPKVYMWWKSAQKTPYPSTLYVTLKSVVPPSEVSGATRSMFATQKEVGHMSYKDLKSMSWSSKDKSQNYGRTLSTWTRLLGQLCRIPNTLTLTLKSGKKGCYMVKFSNDGRNLACACQDVSDHPILVYEIPSGELRGQFQGHFGIVYSLNWNKSDTLLLSASSDGTSRIWDLQKLGENQIRLLPHPGFVYTADFHPRVDSIVVSGCYDEVVRVWDISMPDDHNVLQQEMEEHHGHINSICFDTDDGQKMYSADSVGTIIIWNCYVSDQASRKHFLRDWTKFMEIKDPELKDTPINFIKMHPSGRRLLVHGRNNAIFMFDLRVQRVMQKYFGAENLKEKICCTITPCGSFVFSGSEDGRLYAWNTDTGDQVAVYTQLNYQMPVTDVHYHPRDHMLALCSLGNNHPVYVYKYDPLIAQTDASSPRPMSPLETTDIEELETARSNILKDSTGTKVLSKEEFETLEKVRYQRVLKKLDTATAQMSMMPGMVVPEAFYSPRMDTLGRSSSQLSRNIPYDPHYTLTPRTSGIPPGVLSPHAPPGSGSQLAGQINSHRGYMKSGDGDWRPGFTEVGRTGARSRSPTYFARPPHLSLNTSLGKPQFTFEPSVGKSASCKQVIAIYGYRAQRSDELTLYKGDVITLLYKDNENWWMGELEDGQQGFFPSNYVTEEVSGDQDHHRADKSASVTTSGTVTAIKTKSGDLKFLSGGEESDQETPRSRKKKQVTIDLSKNSHSKSSLPPAGPLKDLNTSIDALLGNYESVA